MSGTKEGTKAAPAATGASSLQSWFIKDILERADLFTFNSLPLEDMEDYDPKKTLAKGTVVKEERVGPEAAFLGPKIWKNAISLPLEEDMGEIGAGAGCGGDEDIEEDAAPSGEFAIMNLEEFFNENNFELDGVASPLLGNEDMLGESDEPTDMDLASPDSEDSSADVKESPGVPCKKQKTNQLPKGENNFLYAESKRAKAEKEKVERRKRKLEAEVDFSPDHLALASVPGADFDPRKRQFSAEELRPQPIIRKRKKNFVLPDEKDDKYWERRQKNNVAARRSREARRLKENQIALRTAFLEKENATLVEELRKSQMAQDRLTAENKILTEKVKRLQGSA